MNPDQNIINPKKTTKRQLRHRSFLLTVNPNKRFLSCHGEEYLSTYNNLKTASQGLSNLDVLKSCITITEENIPFTPQYFKKIQLVARPELSSDRCLLHHHILVTISTYTKVKINLPSVRSHYAQFLGDSFYFNCQYISENNAKAYIEKQFQE